MKSFEERAKAFESKFARDEQLKFKVEARANKLLGLWAAELMDMSGDSATNYARDVIRSDFEEAGTEDVYRKLAGDLGDKVDEMTLRAKMEAVLVEAKTQIINES